MEEEPVSDLVTMLEDLLKTVRSLDEMGRLDDWDRDRLQTMAEAMRQALEDLRSE